MNVRTYQNKMRRKNSKEREERWREEESIRVQNRKKNWMGFSVVQTMPWEGIINDDDCILFNL